METNNYCMVSRIRDNGLIYRNIRVMNCDISVSRMHDNGPVRVKLKHGKSVAYILSDRYD